MTNEIEMTKREMFQRVANLRGRHVANGYEYLVHGEMIGKMESALEAHLETLRQDRGRLVEERDALRNRVQVLESANKIAGERLRVVSEAQEQIGAISHHETQKNASCAPLDAKTAAILGAVVDVQRIVTDWATKGLKAKEAMRLVAGVVNGGPCYSEMLAFEKPEQFVEMEFRWKFDHGVETTRSLIKVCQHEFHPKFPAGEMCTYCGVENPECDHRWGPSNSSNCTKCGVACPL